MNNTETQFNYLNLPRLLQRGDSSAISMISIAENLTERLEEIRLTPEHILLVGYQTEAMRHRVAQRYPQAKIAVLGSAELPINGLSLPFADCTFDLILSNLVLHWLPEKTRTLQEWRRLLKKEGLLLFSTLGGESLYELRTALAQADKYRNDPPWPRVLSFPTLQELGQGMLSARLQWTVLDRDLIRLTTASALTLARKLRQLGSGNPHRPLVGQGDRWTGTAFWHTVDRFYREQFTHGEKNLPVTFELSFGHGWHL